MTLNEIHWASQSAYPILTVLQLFPLLSMVLLLPLRQSGYFYRAAMLLSATGILLAVDLFRVYDHTNTAMQLAEQIRLLSPLSYHAAVDGMSVLFILLTALLSFLVIMYSSIIPLEKPIRLPFIVFAVQATLISMFVTLDLLWFTIMSGIELILLGYMVWRWATSPQRDLAMARYLQFMGFGFVLLLTGVMMLGWNYANVTGGNWSFDLFDLNQVSVDMTISSVIFYLLFYGLAIRMPLFPLHGWLPLVAEHGTVAIAPVFLLGLKIGIYGLLRFVFPLLPEAVLQWHEYVVIFAVTGIFYAAFMAMMQVNMRRLLAFAAVSHTGVLIIGLFSLSQIAFEGAIMLSINFGLATAGLLFMSGFVFWRTRTLLLSKLGSLFDPLPFIGIAFLISGLSIVGMPGTPGFDAAHLVLEASIHRFGALITIAAALGNVVAAGFLLWAFQRAFLSPKVGQWNTRAIQPASFAEQLMAVLIIIIILAAGFYSEHWLALIENSMHRLGSLYSQPGAQG